MSPYLLDTASKAFNDSSNDFILAKGQLENAIKDFNETHRIDAQELNKLTEDELKLIFEKKAVI